MANPLNNLNGQLDRIGGGSASPKAFTQLEKYLQDIEAGGQVGSGNVFTATYQSTSADEIKAFIETRPGAPIVIDNQGQLYTVTYAALLSGDRAMLRTIGSIRGRYYFFTYTISGSSWTVNTFQLSDYVHITIGDEEVAGLIRESGSDKTLYRKMINIGQLPNTATKTVNHDITNLDKVTWFTGIANSGSNNLPLPCVASDPENAIYIGIGLSQITVTTYKDRSDFTSGYVTIYYTKTV